MRRNVISVMILFAMCSLLMCNVAYALQLGGLKGKVVDPYTGKPVAGAKVVATTRTNIETERKYASVTVTTGKDGVFLIKGLEGHEYRLDITKPGYFSIKYPDPMVESYTCAGFGSPRAGNLVYDQPFYLASGVNGLDRKELFVTDKNNGVMWSKKNFSKGYYNLDGAINLIESLNQEKYAGYSDWRLPRNEEVSSFSSLIAASSSNFRAAPYRFLGAIGFNVHDFDFWHTEYGEIWITNSGLYNFNGGSVERYESGSVWPVRGGAALSEVEIKNLNAKVSRAYFKKGLAVAKENQDRDAIAYLNMATVYDPSIIDNESDVNALNSVAWLYATSSNKQYRDGKKAIKYAEKACKLSDWEKPNLIDTLSAAYAEAGDLENAIKMQEKAISLLDDSNMKKDYKKRLKEYLNMRAIEMTPRRDIPTIAEIFTRKTELKGDSIKIKGKVVKVSVGIMGKNWIEIQDGSGDRKDKTDNLMITSLDLPEIGDFVTVSGKVGIDKDFGGGYQYDVIIQESKIIKSVKTP